MKVTFIATVFNEQSSVASFLESLFTQTKMPNEIVIVDAYSSDKTFELLKFYKNKFQKEYPKIKFQIYQKKGNRSTGRNFAIKNSSGEIIVVSDFGCILKENWFEKITLPFQNKRVDVVSGFYKAITSNTFEKCLATYTCVMEDKLNSSFLPSSRSIAFRKSAWEKVGGYPEKLDTAEDLFFARNLKRKGLKFQLVKDAIVFWPQKKNLCEAFKQFLNYAKGDGQALFVRKSTPFLFLRYLIGLGLVIYFILSKQTLVLFIVFCLLFFYILWAIFKNYKYVRKLTAFFHLPVLQVTSDIAVISGFSFGIFKRYGI